MGIIEYAVSVHLGLEKVFRPTDPDLVDVDLGQLRHVVEAFAVQLARSRSPQDEHELRKKTR